MSRHKLRCLRSGCCVLAAALALPALAGAAPGPVVRSLFPLHLRVGEQLKVHGAHFIAGKDHDTVVLRRFDSGPNVFVKADDATSRTITITVPRELARFLSNRGGHQHPTRFRVGVLAHRFTRSLTPRRRSPVIAPANVAASAAPPTANAAAFGSRADCGGALLGHRQVGKLGWSSIGHVTAQLLLCLPAAR